MGKMTNLGSENATHWLNDPVHREFLAADAKHALDFFDASPKAGGGFHTLDLAGKPQPSDLQELHTTTRLVHSYALAQMAGRQDRAGIVDQGMNYLWQKHRDTQHGGYIWSLNGDDVAEGTKLAYGHVFVLLAASSAKMIGHPDADRLLTDISEILDRHYWDDEHGLFQDEFTADWQPFSDYRGMNANMHGVEALLAAYEATGDTEYLNRAGRIMEFFIAGQAVQENWRIPEHYTGNWQPDYDYVGNPMFRPSGTTPGHSFEMARLYLQWWDLAGRPEGAVIERTRGLVDTAFADGWDTSREGIIYALKSGGQVNSPKRFWWPVTEAIGVTAALIKLEGKAEDEAWYRRLWQFADAHLIDHKHGGWFPEIDDNNQPDATQFEGKPDIYHAIQADLLPLAKGISGAAEALKAMRPLA